jgi:hypothetical protein
MGSDFFNLEFTPRDDLAKVKVRMRRLELGENYSISISPSARHERTRSWKEASAAVGETDELVDERSRGWPSESSPFTAAVAAVVVIMEGGENIRGALEHRWQTRWRHPNLAAPVLKRPQLERLVFGGYGFRLLSFFLVSQHSPLCLPDCSSSALETSLTH